MKKATSFSALNNFETCAKKYWHLRIARDVKEVEGEALRYGKRVHKALENYVGKGTALPAEFTHLEKHVARFKEYSGAKHCEMELAINEQYQPVDWFAKDVWIRAKLDLVVIGGDKALIVDYKTGKMKDDGFTQLRLAAALLMLFFKDIKLVTLAYMWTEHNGQVTYDVFHRHEFPLIWNELKPRLDAFEEAHVRDNFPANPSGLCKRHCPVTQCPHNGNG